MDQVSLQLYVSGEANSSRKARENFVKLCEHHLSPMTEVVVIDVLKEPHRAEAARVLATPTLIVNQPGRQKRVIGDLSDTERVLDFLGLGSANSREPDK